MSELSLDDIAQRMKEIDCAMLTTIAPDGGIASRPMSNNGDVEQGGDSYYFTSEEADMVGEIADNPNVGLTFHGDGAFFIAVAGEAELIRDKETLKVHWTPDLEKWFTEGLETPGLVLLKVNAKRLHYWDGEDNGEIAV